MRAATSPHLERLDWVDVLRGVAILIVVVGHSWRGLFGAGLMEPGQFSGLDRAIYSFHMPLFFLISGLFYMRGLATPPGAFAMTKVKRLLYPMVLWTYVFVLAKLAAGPFANAPISFEDLLVSPIPGRWHFWFLWALFLMQLALYVLRPLQTRDAVRTPVLMLVLLVSVALSYTAFSLPGAAWPWIGNAILMLPYFVIGIIVGDHLKRIPQTGAVPVIAAMALAVGFIVIMVFPLQDVVPGILIAGTMSGLTVLACAASRYLPVTLSACLAEMGRATMAIFLLHTIFSAALREALLVMGLQNLSLHMGMSVAIGIVGPLAMLYLSQRLGWVRALGF